MMPYWQRVVLGILLGLLALFSLWYFVGITWLTATVSALVAPLVFLGSFFLFTADRPDEGYEQVLFDRPNTILSLVMIVLFASAGVGTGFLSLDAAPAGRPASAIAEDYQTAFSEYQSGAITSPAAKERLSALRAELGDTTGSPAAEWLGKTLDAAIACANQGTAQCPEAFNAFIEYRIAGAAPAEA